MPSRHYGPSLFSQDGFISSMATPIIKARRGKESDKFYNITEVR
jgi:hypothetical protein